MAKKEKKQEVEGADKKMLDGGILSTGVSKEMRDAIVGVAERMERPVSWVQRLAFKMYLESLNVSLNNEAIGQ